MATSKRVLEFWLDQCKPSDWYAVSEELDNAIRNEFLADWKEIMTGGKAMWLTYPSGALAYIIVADQFSRNMFRGSPDSFASDRLARTVAKMAIDRKWDMRISAPARQFFYMPLCHSENLNDQDRSVRLFKSRMNYSEAEMVHACAHREQIREFGRFPGRNEGLGRTTTQAEQTFLQDGGYGALVKRLQESGLE